MLQIENEKKNNNKNSSCNIIMDNLKKNEKNKGISRNQINNLNNIIAKNKIND